MTETEIGVAEARQLNDEIDWRHFWLANVMIDTDRQPLKVVRPHMRARKNSLSRRLHSLHHMRATLGLRQTWTR